MKGNMLEILMLLAEVKMQEHWWLVTPLKAKRLGVKMNKKIGNCFHRGGGSLVSVFAFYSNDLSSETTGSAIFIV